MVIFQRIEEIFAWCANENGVVDFIGAAKLFWPVLDNNASLCDLSGVSITEFALSFSRFIICRYLPLQILVESQTPLIYNYSFNSLTVCLGSSFPWYPIMLKDCWRTYLSQKMFTYAQIPLIS